MSYQEYLDQEVEFISVERKAAKMNVRMFNFSKMVQDPRSLRYPDHKDYIRQRDITGRQGPTIAAKSVDHRGEFGQYASVF